MRGGEERDAKANFSHKRDTGEERRGKNVADQWSGRVRRPSVPSGSQMAVNEGKWRRKRRGEREREEGNEGCVAIVCTVLRQ